MRRVNGTTVALAAAGGLDFVSVSGEPRSENVAPAGRRRYIRECVDWRDFV